MAARSSVTRNRQALAGGAPTQMAKEQVIAVAALIGAVLASTCCILPFALFVIGISGAWIANLTALSPYQPIFLAFAAACLIAGYWLVYVRACTGNEPTTCRTSLAGKITKPILWIATVLVIAAAPFPYLSSAFIDP